MNNLFESDKNFTKGGSSAGFKPLTLRFSNATLAALFVNVGPPYLSYHSQKEQWHFRY